MSLIDKVFEMLNDANITNPNIHREGLLLIARITTNRLMQRGGVFEIIGKYMGMNKNTEVVNAALTLLHNKVIMTFGYLRIPVNENMSLWKKLVTEFLSENAAQEGGKIRRRIAEFFVRFSQADLIKVLGENKKQVYLKLFPFNSKDTVILDFVAKMIESDDEFIEAGLEKNILDSLEDGINGKNRARNEVIKVITNIMCSRPIYLTKVMEHSIWRKMVQQSTKKNLAVYGALIAIGILKAFGQCAIQEQIYEVFSNGNIIMKCIHSLNRSRLRELLANCDLTAILNKVIKLQKKAGDELKKEITGCASRMQEFTRFSRDRLIANPRPYWNRWSVVF